VLGKAAQVAARRVSDAVAHPHSHVVMISQIFSNFLVFAYSIALWNCSPEGDPLAPQSNGQAVEIDKPP
jgi:hypothetical protein